MITPRLRKDLRVVKHDTLERPDDSPAVRKYLRGEIDVIEFLDYMEGRAVATQNGIDITISDTDSRPIEGAHRGIDSSAAMRALVEQKRAQRRSGPFRAAQQKAFMDQTRQRDLLYADWIQERTLEAVPLPSRRPCAMCGKVDYRPPKDNLCLNCANRYRSLIADGVHPPPGWYD